MVGWAEHQGPVGHGEGTGSHRGSEWRRDGDYTVSQVSLALVHRVEAGEREEFVERVCAFVRVFGEAEPKVRRNGIMHARILLGEMLL